MKNIMISSNKSGGGKTTFTICLMKAIMDLGMRVQGYKTGPDYIDTRFHSVITGIDSRNLDSVIMTEEDIKKAFFKSLGDINVIEGVMGFYDGLGTDTNGSAYNLSMDYNLPVVLVLSPKSQLMSFVAELKGILEFRDNNIIGIVLTNISMSYYEMLKVCIESELDIKVFGYFESLPELKFESRHLGLIQSSEIENISEKVSLGAESLAKTVDISAIISESEKYTFKYEGERQSYLNNLSNMKSDNTGENHSNKPVCAVAMDKAFSFYYKDNLDMLEDYFNVTYFSPINDKELPQNADFLYIGGGYPEVFRKELSENSEMLKSIREKLEDGLPCYAECGGLMYLTESIEGSPSVGFIAGLSKMTDRLQHFGYCKGEIVSGKFKGSRFCGHEFHKSVVESDNQKMSRLHKTSNPNMTWTCGFEKKNTYAHYAHIHFSTSEILDKFIILAEEYKKNKGC